MKGVSEGKFVRLKRSSQWPESYVPLEQKPVEVLELIALHEVSDKPLLASSEENRMVAVLNAVVENATVHHNGRVVVELHDVKPLSFFERMKLRA